MIILAKETASRRGRFDAWYNGEKIVSSSRTPFLTAARVLMQRGFDPAAILDMRLGAAETPSLGGPIGKAAKLMVDEVTGAPRFRPYVVWPNATENE